MQESSPAQSDSGVLLSEAAHPSSQDGSTTPAQVPLGDLQQSLADAVQQEHGKQDLLDALTELLARYAKTTAVAYFERDQAGQFRPLRSDHLDELNAALGTALNDWQAWSSAACETSQIVRHQIRGEITADVFCVPVLLPGGRSEALCAVFRSVAEPAHGIVLLLQSVAIGLQLWHARREHGYLEDEAQSLSAILDLAAKIQSADSPQHAAFVVAGELQSYLKCERVALATREDGGTCCKLQALSGLAKFDRHSAYARSVEAALDEALLRRELTVWHVGKQTDTEATLAHQKLCATAGCDCVSSEPLRDHGGRVVGAWLFLGNSDFAVRDEAIRFVHAASEPVASSLAVLAEARRSLPSRMSRSVRRQLRGRGLRIALAAAGVTMLALCLPWPYKLTCDSQLEPVTRRFVVAPFDVRLEKTLVEPGDLVRSGEVLARLDGREIRWELAGLEAELNRARKERDTAMAARKTAAAQIAKLEMEALAVKIRLLEHRSGQLKITSPIDGILVSGDLERVEGAPLNVGDTMFEVAPLDQMIVEVAIPESEIAHARQGQEVRIKLEAYPGETWSGTLARIHPRSEMRDEQSVFIGEVHLANPCGQMRPGMNGEAKIVGSWRALGWILFHRPADALIQKLGW